MTTSTDITLPHSVRFAEKWVEWIQFRKEIKKPYKTDRGINAALNKLKLVTEQEACAMIDNSIANEYQGIFSIKKSNQKGETSLRVAWLKSKEVSKEPAKYFNPEEGKSYIIGKIKKAYETGSRLNDYGSVYTKRLEQFLSTPEDVLSKIHGEVLADSLVKPRNRFEEKVEINVELECRNRVLRWNIDKWRKENRKIYLELR